MFQPHWSCSFWKRWYSDLSWFVMIYNLNQTWCLTSASCQYMLFFLNVGMRTGIHMRFRNVSTTTRYLSLSYARTKSASAQVHKFMNVASTSRLHVKLQLQPHENCIWMNEIDTRGVTWVITRSDVSKSANRSFSYTTVISPNSCNLISDPALAAGQTVSLSLTANVCLIMYSPHQHLPSQGRPVYSKFAKWRRPDK